MIRDQISRRDFLQDSAISAAAIATAGAMPAGAAAQRTRGDFASNWSQSHDRVWLGPEYWANPLQDWRLAGGRIECIRAAPDRNVHLLTRALGAAPGDLSMAVRIGRIGGVALADGRGSFGFRIGIMGPLREYRNSLLSSNGLNAGATADGGLFIGDLAAARPGMLDTNLEAIELRLSAQA